MVEKDRFLVVLSIIEGRNFPKRSKHTIILEARFDGELLTSDPIPHQEEPDFKQELAWELNKKTLQQHRLQRTSIKVNCYATDGQTAKESIGYVVLDLRSAQNKQTSKWHPVLNSKYHKSKPELRLGLYLDEDNASPEPQLQQSGGFKAKEAPPRMATPDSRPLSADYLKPVLDEEEGFYQLGNPQHCTEVFMLSVTVAYAANLSHLIPSSVALPGTGYFFYYSLLGNDVTNEPFQNLLNPTFPPERASVKIRSSVDVLSNFFSSQPGIQAHLCCGDQSLGSTEIPLTPLLKKGSTEIYMKPVCIDGSFELIPPSKLKQPNSKLPADQLPVVGVSIVLRKEDIVMTKSTIKDPQVNTTQVSPKPATKLGVTVRKPTTSPSPIKLQEKKFDDGKKEKVKKSLNYSDDFEENTADNASDMESESQKFTAERDSSTPPPTQTQPSTTTDSSTHHVMVPPQTHHFTLSVDLRSIKDMESSHTVNVFLRYSYPFFGSAAPILTHPTVEIRRGMEVLLPQSFCAFDFACGAQQLQDTFHSVPLLVEVWNRDRQLATDVLLGVATVPLSPILTAEKSKLMIENDKSGWRQVMSERMNALSTDGKQQKVAEVTIVLSLEDWGSISQQEIQLQAPTPPPTQDVYAPQPLTAPVPPELDPAYLAQKEQLQLELLQQEEARAAAEYQAALEVEMWKEAQEQMFENQLKEKEMIYMKALAEEWKKRDKERESLVQKRVSEYTQLEGQLKGTIADMEKRERQLLANEQEVMRLRTDLQHEHDRHLHDITEASRRMKEDCDHRIQLERTKVREYEELIARYKMELTEAEKRHSNQDREFQQYKADQNGKPEVRLQSEINMLTLEKVELERKLDSVTKSKIHYKQQWGRALKELARLKQKEQAAAKAHLQRQQQELEHMRLRYLAAEEKEVVKSDKKELEDIKNELIRLREMEEEHKKKETADIESSDESPVISESHHMNGDMSMGGGDADEHITRLIQERDTLLHTGVYTHQDRIIAELDRQIKESIAGKNAVR